MKQRPIYGRVPQCYGTVAEQIHLRAVPEAFPVGFSYI